MKLLLDEMYSSAIAVQLRQRGHDVVAVTEREDLISLSDRDLFARAASEGRALVTNNVIDYVALFREALQVGSSHCGLLLTDDRRLPRTRGGIGELVRVLEALLSEHAEDGALVNQLRWLP